MMAAQKRLITKRFLIPVCLILSSLACQISFGTTPPAPSERAKIPLESKETPRTPSPASQRTSLPTTEMPKPTPIPPTATHTEVPKPPPGLVEFVIKTGGGQRQHLAIQGDILTWSEMGAQDWDIHAYNLATKTEFMVIDEPQDQVNPAVSGNIIVWEDHRTTLPHIYGYDIQNGKVFNVTHTDSPQFEPDIDGKIVVFRDWRGVGTCSWGGSEYGPSTYCDWDIWAVDLTTQKEFPVAVVNRSEQVSPHISGNLVIWRQGIQSESGIDWVLYGTRLGSNNDPAPICGVNYYNYPIFDQDILVWDDLAQIKGCQISNGRSFDIAISQGGKDTPEINSNIVVWSDGRWGNADIYAYNLATGAEFAICLAPGDQVDPVIDGDRVAWIDRRNGSDEIYAAQLPGMNGPQPNIIVPAPTHTATPLPSPTPTLIAPPKAILSEPANGSTIDTLVPVLRFNLPAGDPTWQVNINIHFSPTPNYWRVGQAHCDGEVCEYEILDNLDPGVTYEWAVNSIFLNCINNDLYNCFAMSDVWTFTTPTLPIPPAPVILEPANNSTVKYAGLEFKWQPIEDVSAYYFQGRESNAPADQWEYSLEYYTGSRLTHLPINEIEMAYGKPSEAGHTYYFQFRVRTPYAWSEYAEVTFTLAP